jgi:recombination protein RecT
MTQITLYQSTVFGDLTPEDVKTVHETIATGTNESQFRLFMGIAKASGANPLLGEIHASVFQGKLTTQFGVDFYVRKAKETEGYRGYDVQLVHDNDSFKMHQARAEDGRYYIMIDEHSFGFPRGKVIGGYAFAYREGFEPFSIIMDIAEVEHYQRSQIGMQKRMWTDQLPDMFKKHMVKRVLKAAFGLTFENEERDAIQSTPSVDNVDSYQRQDITPPDAPQAPQSGEKGKTVGNVKNVQDAVITESQEPTQAEKDAVKRMIGKNFDMLGISEATDIQAYIASVFPDLGKNKLTYEQQKQLVAHQEQQLAEGPELPEELV